MPVTTELHARLDELTAALTVIEAARYARDYPDSPIEPDVVVWKERSKYIAIDFERPQNSGYGGSGAWLVDKATGELYNIHGYGKPDINKKRKADLGNVYSVDPAWLHARRHNYLR